MKILFKDAHIIPMTPDGKTYSCMGISGRKIVYLGNSLPKDHYDRTISLGGRYIYPTLCDSHLHLLYSIVLSACSFNICTVTEDGVRPDSLAGIEKAIRDYTAENPGKGLIMINQYIPTGIREGRLPFRQELDEWTGGRETVIYTMDGHSCALSSSLASKLGIETETGILSGADYDMIQGKITNYSASKVNLRVLARGIANFTNQCLEYGVTKVCALDGDETINSDNTINDGKMVRSGNAINEDKTVRSDNTINDGKTVRSDNSINDGKTVRSDNTINEGKTVRSDNAINEGKTVRSDNTINDGKTVRSDNAMSRKRTSPRPDSLLLLLIFLARRMDIRVRLYPEYMDYRILDRIGRYMKRPRIGGCAKWELDGSVGSHSAAFYHPFRDTGTTGHTYYEDEYIAEKVREGLSRGLQMTCHAIGTKAIDQITDAYRINESLIPRSGPMPRIDHFEFPSEAAVEFVKSHRLAVTVQPGYAYADKICLHTYEKFLAEEDLAGIIPLKELADGGALLLGSSDSPVQSINPYEQMRGMMNYYRKEQSLTASQAFASYTRNPARALAEKEGILALNGPATFFISSADILHMTADEIVSVRADAVFIDGKQMRKMKGTLAEFLQMIFRIPHQI